MSPWVPRYTCAEARALATFELLGPTDKFEVVVLRHAFRSFYPAYVAPYAVPR